MKIKTRRYYLYYLLRIGFFLLGAMPLKAALAVAGWGGKLVYKYLGKYREIALENLRLSLDVPEREIARIAQGVFVNLAKNGAEWLKLGGAFRLDPGKIITEVEGLEKLREATSGGTGAVVLTSHFGNWELVGIALRYLQVEGVAVARKIYFHKYESFIRGMRRRYDVGVIYRDESPKKFLKLLKSGGSLGLLADQDMKSVDGVFVDLFGRPCFTPTAPVKLALATGAKIVLVFMVRKADDTHKLVVRGVLDPASEKGKDGLVEEYTQKWTDIFEDMVREYPEQWVWIHERWKTTPREAERHA